jgi:hypothetical protein
LRIKSKGVKKNGLTSKFGKQRNRRD